MYGAETGQLIDDKVQILARTYAQSVAGAIQSHNFNAQSKSFKLIFSANMSATQRLQPPSPTRIYASSRWHYKGGLEVLVEPKHKAFAKVDGDFVYVYLTDLCNDGDGITVTVDPTISRDIAGMSVETTSGFVGFFSGVSEYFVG